MNFEQSLRYELTQIPELNNKVFANYAKEGEQAPFVVYISEEGIQDKTLDGYLVSKEVEFQLNIVHKTYSDMKALVKQVLPLVISFQSREIGIDGLFIQDISYDNITEIFEQEIGLFRTIINFTTRF